MGLFFLTTGRFEVLRTMADARVWFPISAGLLTFEHCRRIGPAWMVFLWLIHEQRLPKDGEVPGSMRFLRASWHWPRPTTPRWPAAIWLNPQLWWQTLCWSGLFHAGALCCGRAPGRGTCSMRLELSVELRRAWCSWTSSPQDPEKGRGLLMCRNQCKPRSPLICIRNHVSAVLPSAFSSRRAISGVTPLRPAMRL